MSDAAGVARLAIEVSGAEEATTKIEGIKKATIAASVQTEAANKRNINSIERHIKSLNDQKNTLGLTARETDIYKISQKGATEAQIASIHAIHDQIEAYRKLNPEIARSAMSEKEKAWALRGVPAQFTDIVTSLQGGQKPITVFLQQGGQLRDMFGGAGNAAKAMGGYVLGLINPFTIGAASIATLGLAAYQGSKEQEAFAKALIMTGNAAGVTIGQLSGMAKTISEGSKFTQGAAASALASFAADGNAPREKLQAYAKVALGLEREMGISVADTVKQFAELGKDPVAASLKLNETTRFLTTSVYLQIRALVDQGKTVEAGRVAMDAYSNTMSVRIPEMAANLGTLEVVWRSIIGTAKDAWDAMLGIGRESTYEQKLEKLTSLLDAAKQRAGLRGKSTNSEVESIEEQIRLAKKAESFQQTKAANAAEDQKKLKARTEYDALHNQYLSKEALLKKEIAQIEETGKRAGMAPDVIKKDVAAAIRKSQGAGFQDAITKAQQAQNLAGIKAGLEAEVLEYTHADKLLTAAHSLRLIDDKTFFDEKLRLIRATGDAEVRGLEAEIAVAKKAKFTGDNRVQQAIENQTKINDLEGKLNTSRTNTTAAINQNAFEVAAANKKIQRSYEDAGFAAKNYLAQIQRQYSREVAGVGKGDEFRQNQGALGQIEDRKISKIQGFDTQRRNNQITQAEYDEHVRIANKSYDDEVAAYIKSRIDIKTAQGDWTNGYSEAMANLLTQSRNTAANLSGIFTSAFTGISSGIGNSFAESLMHGKGLQQGLIGVADQVATQFISSLITMQIQSAITDQAMLASKTTTAIAGAEISIAAKTTETTTNVGLSAIEGAANAFKAMAGIPVIGPVLAVGASLAALSFVNSLLSGGNSKGGDSTATVVNRNPYPTTTSVPLAGARALGGPVAAGSLYEVNERGPEIITTGNRDYLMMGGKGGYVTPNGGGRGGDLSGLASQPITHIAVTVLKNPNGNYEMTPEMLGKLLVRGKRDNIKGFANV